MVRLDALFACRGQLDQRWELPAPLSKSVEQVIIGWSVSPTPVDAGLPEPVANVLSNALVRHFLVTYPTNKGRRISFVHAREREGVRSAFDDAYFDWSQKQQCLFLSPTQAPPPELSENDLIRVLQSKTLYELTDLGVNGLVLPGVDGDVAGIYTFTQDLQHQLLGDIGAACDEAGSRLQFVSEVEFIEALATR